MCGRILTLSDGTSLVGAGFLDVTIGLWGYRIFAIVIVVATIFAVYYMKKGKFKKMAASILVIPGYLVLMFVVLFGADLLVVRRNTLDREHRFIEYNIEFTRSAYNINIEERVVPNSGAITTEDIYENQDIIANINLLNERVVLRTLEEFQTSLGDYSFPVAGVAIYNIDGVDTLVYISPREIVSNQTRTYNNRTFRYTHGHGVIINYGARISETGLIEYVQQSFDGRDQRIEITRPRIYFGLETNSPIITNTNHGPEHGYPLTATRRTSYIYTGEAGISLNFMDRLILGIREGDLRFAFSTNVNRESRIITQRNIIDRAKAILPIEYDPNPYMVITDDGRLVWVLDGYTMSNNHPFSQETTVQLSSRTKKENKLYKKFCKSNCGRL